MNTDINTAIEKFNSLMDKYNEELASATDDKEGLKITKKWEKKIKTAEQKLEKEMNTAVEKEDLNIKQEEEEFNKDMVKKEKADDARFKKEHKARKEEGNHFLKSK